MKEEKLIHETREPSIKSTPFERAEYNAAIFVGGFMFLEKFTEMVEQYQALEIVMSELETEHLESEELTEVYNISKSVLQAEKERMEENFVSAGAALQQKFGYEA